MSTDERELGETIPTTDPAEGIGTPATSMAAKTRPEEVTTRVKCSDGLISVVLRSETIEGTIMLEPAPARQLRDQITAAIDETTADE